MAIKDAAECVKNVADDYQKEQNTEEDEEEEEFEDWEDDSGSMNFAADPEKSAKAAAECTSLIDKYSLGEISGKLFAQFFNNELKPLV